MKHYYIVLLFLVLTSCQLFEKESKPKEVYGCMDSTATNYNPDATIDDGSCQYPQPDVYGCTDSLAANYNPEANIDDGSCDYCQKGYSFVQISTDKGLTWERKCLKQQIGKVNDIAIVDQYNIWMVTTGRVYAQNGYIMHSSNGGDDWEIQFVDSVGSRIMDYIEMFDQYNGLALADWSRTEPMFLKTSDGGQNWEPTTNQAIGISGDSWRRVDFVDINIGYFFESGINPQKIYKTKDSGYTWEVTSFDGYLWVLRFFNENIGLAYEGDSLVHRTLDGGETWQRIPNNIIRNGDEDIEFDLYDPSKVWLVVGDLFFSNDTGSTWIKCLDENIIGSIINVTESDVWMFNYRGQLYKINKDDCSDYEQILLPEIDYGTSSFGYNIAIDGDVIVIPGYVY